MRPARAKNMSCHTLNPMMTSDSIQSSLGMRAKVAPLLQPLSTGRPLKIKFYNREAGSNKKEMPIFFIRKKSMIRSCKRAYTSASRTLVEHSTNCEFSWLVWDFESAKWSFFEWLFDEHGCFLGSDWDDVVWGSMFFFFTQTSSPGKWLLVVRSELSDTSNFQWIAGGSLWCENKFKEQYNSFNVWLADVYAH